MPLVVCSTLGDLMDDRWVRLTKFLQKRFGTRIETAKNTLLPSLEVQGVELRDEFASTTTVSEFYVNLTELISYHCGKPPLSFWEKLKEVRPRFEDTITEIKALFDEPEPEEVAPEVDEEPAEQSGYCMATDIAGFAGLDIEQRRQAMAILRQHLLGSKIVRRASTDKVYICAIGDGFQVVVADGGMAQIAWHMLECADAVVKRCATVGLQVRVGVSRVYFWCRHEHEGLEGGGLGVCRRLAEMASPGQVLVTEAVVKKVEAQSGKTKNLEPRFRPVIMDGERERPDPWELVLLKEKRPVQFRTFLGADDDPEVAPPPEAVATQSAVVGRLRVELTALAIAFKTFVVGQDNPYHVRATLWLPAHGTNPPALASSARVSTSEHEVMSRVRYVADPDKPQGPVARAFLTGKLCDSVSVPTDPKLARRWWKRRGVPTRLFDQFTCNSHFIICVPITGVVPEETVGVVCLDGDGPLQEPDRVQAFREEADEYITTIGLLAELRRG